MGATPPVSHQNVPQTTPCHLPVAANFPAKATVRVLSSTARWFPSAFHTNVIDLVDINAPKYNATFQDLFCRCNVKKHNYINDDDKGNKYVYKGALKTAS